MRKLMFSAMAVLFALLMASPARAQAQHTPRGKAMDISKAEIDATVQKTASAPVSDQQIRVMNINGDYNVGVGVVHRAKTAGRDVGGGVEHSQITEVYHVISGNGPVMNGVSRKLAPGDVVIIPPNTPHWFSEITTDQIVYLVVRVDPKKVLPAGYVAK